MTVQAFCAGPRTLDAKLVWQGKWGHSHLCLQHLRGRRLVHTPSQSEELGTAMASEHPGLAARGKTAPSPQVTLWTSHLRACGRRKPACLPEVPCLGAQQPRPINPDAAKSCLGKKGSDRRLWSLTAPPRDEPLLKHPENSLLSAGHTGHRHLTNSQTHTQQPL